MFELILMLFPRFIKDRVALVSTGKDDFTVLCLEDQVLESDTVACYGTVRTFTWLGFATGGKCIIDEDKD